MGFNNAYYKKLYDDYMKKNNLTVNAVARKILCFVEGWDENDDRVSDDYASSYKKYRIKNIKPKTNRVEKIAEFFNAKKELFESDSVQTNNMEIKNNVLLIEALQKALDLYFNYLSKLTVPVVEGLAEIPELEYDIDNLRDVREEMENPTNDLVNFTRYICFLPKKFYGMLYTALYYFYHCEQGSGILYYDDLQKFYNINVNEYLDKHYHINEKEEIEKFFSENMIYDFIDEIHDKFIKEANDIANSI